MNYIGMVYVDLIKKGVKRLEDVKPESLRLEVEDRLRKEGFLKDE